MKNGASRVLLRNDFIPARQCWRFELLFKDNFGRDLVNVDYYTSTRNDGMNWLEEHILGLNSNIPRYLHAPEQDAINDQIQYYRGSYFDSRRFAILGEFALDLGNPAPAGHINYTFKVMANDSSFNSSFLLGNKVIVPQTFNTLTDDYTGNPNSPVHTVYTTPSVAADTSAPPTNTGGTPPDLLDLVTF